jgi:hypothetical protein
MDKLNFYHQKRSDGGLRTGIEFNDERVLERFELGDSPQDSALLWFVDVRCSGKSLPLEPERIRAWFLQQGDVICAGLREMAQNLVAGVDPGWPMRKSLVSTDDLRIAIYCSAMRRLDGREISEILSALASSWSDVIRGLAVYEASAIPNA